MISQPAVLPAALQHLTSALSTPLPRVLRPQRALPSDAVRPTRAEVNLAHLRHNLRVLRRAAGTAQIWSVLKADAYGHGAKAVARTLERAGTEGVCVALLEEAVELRQAGLRIPVLVMGGYYGRAWGEVLRHGLTPVVVDAGQVDALAEEVRYAGSEALEVHLKVDTGMGRLGVPPGEVAQLARRLASTPELKLVGLMTHLACADSADALGLAEQLAVFDEVTELLQSFGLRPSLRHAANSAALLGCPASRLELVRPGVALFGVDPSPGLCADLRPVMTVRTEVIALRDVNPGQAIGYGWAWRATRRSRIATIPMGYADGLSRALSNRGEVLVRGRRAPIVGMVSMDMTMIDVTAIDGVSLGDECVVLGRQKGPLGDDTVTVQELAQALNTIPWEVLSAISRRVPRFYREPG